MFRILIFFFILSFNNFALSSIKEKIISKLDQTNNLSFYFKQTIDGKN